MKNKTVSYESNQYSNYNDAVHKELKKHDLLIVERKGNIAWLIVKVLLLISIIILILVLAYKLIFNEFIINNTSNLNKEELLEIVSTGTEGIQKSLSELQSNVEMPNDNVDLIDTEYTVFRRTITDSGETAVTGLTYSPDNLSVPNQQYCYLEISTENGELGGIPLAEKSTLDEIAFETEDPQLKKLATRFCKFK